MRPPPAVDLETGGSLTFGLRDRRSRPPLLPGKEIVRKTRESAASRRVLRDGNGARPRGFEPLTFGSVGRTFRASDRGYRRRCYRDATFIARALGARDRFGSAADQ